MNADPDPQPCFKLPDFGTTSPTAWFGVTEAQFLLRDSETQRDCYSLVTTVLSGASACSVAQILACPGDNCYDDLRATRLVAQQITTFQKAEKLFASEPLDHLPSELLSEMLVLVHPGEEWTCLVSMLFLHCLPVAVRLQVTKDDHEDVRALSDKADW